MARPFRLQAEHCFYHITCRGDDRKRIFSSDRDFAKFLEYLQAAREKYKFHVFAYCLMPNHYHLFLETLSPNLSKIMQYLNGSYTTYYNTKRQRTGHLFQGRFKSILVDENAYFMELTRYIHLNPVRANIVEAPQDYQWSSFGGYIRPGNNNYIDYQEVSKYLAMTPAAYKEFVMSGIAKKSDIFKKVYAGYLLGGTTFIKDKLDQFRQEIESGDFAHRRQVRDSISTDSVVDAVAAAFNVPRDKIIGRKNSTALERKIAIYILRRITTKGNKEIGSYFGIGETAVGKSRKKAEEVLREDRGLMKRVEKVFSVFRV